jgi:hypothetical protein
MLLINVLVEMHVLLLEKSILSTKMMVSQKFGWGKICLYTELSTDIMN